MRLTDKDLNNLAERYLNEDQMNNYQSFDEPGLFKQWAGLYSGKLKGWMIYATIMNVLIAAVTTWVLVRYFMELDLTGYIWYGSIALFGMFLITMFKIWHWMQIDKRSVIREIRRMEYLMLLLMSEKEQKD